MAIRRSQFTLIEVIMALIIIVVAIVAITGIFPISMRMHNNAMRQNQAVDIAEEIIKWAAFNVRNKGLSFTNTEADMRSLLVRASLDHESSEWYNPNKQEVGTSYSYHNDPTTENLTSGTFAGGLVRVVRNHDAYRGDEEIRVTELDVVIALWESPETQTRYIHINDTDPTKIELNKSAISITEDDTDGDLDLVRLNLEASWPGSAKYEDRKKFSMVMEVNRKP